MNPGFMSLLPVTLWWLRHNGRCCPGAVRRPLAVRFQYVVQDLPDGVPAGDLDDLLQRPGRAATTPPGPTGWTSSPRPAPSPWPPPRRWGQGRRNDDLSLNRPDLLPRAWPRRRPR